MKNDYEIRGDVTKIFISSPKYGEFETLIDTADLKLLVNVGSITVWWSDKTRSFYAHCNVKIDGRWKTKKLHRLLFNEPEGLEVDHINHDTLNNRRSTNLRVSTKSENQQNRSGPTRRSKSGIRGVYWNKRLGKWCAGLRIHKQRVHVGVFDDISLASRAVSEARKNHMTHSDERGGLVGR